MRDESPGNDYTPSASGTASGEPAVNQRGEPRYQTCSKSRQSEALSRSGEVDEPNERYLLHGKLELLLVVEHVATAFGGYIETTADRRGL